MTGKKDIRNNFRNAGFKRDKYSCRVCGLKSCEEESRFDLDFHHITDRKLMPNGGYVLSNGITLCKPCHEDAEIWHSSDHLQFKDGMHPKDLYRIIKSSYEEAYADSEKLSD